MTAPVRPTPEHDPAGGAGRGTAVQTRLPWWGVLLPAVGFVLLLVLLLDGGPAHAAQHATGSPLTSLLMRLWEIFGG
ncbi:hypothetical protein [Streptomyces albus]|uniref:hypothetical protein n=1 Tax=Streptomyces sp. NRRL F-5639 TaxID=1463867 RepID=UPI0004CB3B9E|nr:hypothetical protein [Streptomyces sp. NRRL F-5639]